MPHVSERPYVLLSCAASIDGYIDDATDQRLLLSNDEDFDRVDGLRAESDAILVGANTIRHDNPRLLVCSQERRDQRLARGPPASPMKVTMTGRGDLDPAAHFFTAGDAEMVVFCGSASLETTRNRLGGLATVLDAGASVEPEKLLVELAARGVGRLLVEGGMSVHTQFLTASCADELQLVIAPFFIGDPRAPRFVSEGQFPWHPGHHARLVEVRQIDGVALLRYALSDRFPDG